MNRPARPPLAPGALTTSNPTAPFAIAAFCLSPTEQRDGQGNLRWAGMPGLLEAVEESRAGTPSTVAQGRAAPHDLAELRSGGQPGAAVPTF